MQLIVSTLTVALSCLPALAQAPGYADARGGTRLVGGAIAGIVVAIIAILLVCLLCIVVMMRRRRVRGPVATDPGRPMTANECGPFGPFGYGGRQSTRYSNTSAGSQHGAGPGYRSKAAPDSGNGPGTNTVGLEMPPSAYAAHGSVQSPGSVPPQYTRFEPPDGPPPPLPTHPGRGDYKHSLHALRPLGSLQSAQTDTQFVGESRPHQI